MVDKDITVPSLLGINIIFICITVIYLCIKLFMGNTLMLGISYIIVVVFTQYLYNMWIILATHKNSNTTIALSSLVFWVIFIVIYFIINIGFPSWKVAFSNTFGYIIANIINPVNKKFKEILKDGSTPPFIDKDKPMPINDSSTKNDSTLLLAIRNMKSDPHFILTKATYENHTEFLNDLKANEVFINDDEKVKEVFKVLGKWYFYKDIVSEGIWLILAGSLTIAVTYYYIVSAPISPSPEAIEQSTTDAKDADDDDTKPKFVTMPTSFASFT